MDTFISNSPEETFALGQRWAAEARPGWIVGLIGDLGTGKTQLVKGLAALLAQVQAACRARRKTSQDIAGAQMHRHGNHQKMEAKEVWACTAQGHRLGRMQVAGRERAQRVTRAGHVC